MPSSFMIKKPLSNDSKISISTLAPAIMLFKYRRSKNPCYSSFEIALDLLMALLMAGVYISGTVILASVEISAWFNPHNYKLLLPESSLSVLGMQTTGVIATN